jgi:hypothetical protein
MFKLVGLAMGLALVLAGCGGGGGCSSGLGAVADSVGLCNDPVNKAPLAEAGQTQNVPVGAVVTLDGSLSRDPEGSTLSYNWTWVSRPANSAAVLASGDTVKAAFVADVPGTYVLSLVVHDGKINSTASTVTVNATRLNTVPVASAGTNQVVVLGQSVVLDGTASADADRQPITFRWRMVSRPSGSTVALTGDTTARPTFTPDVVGLYALSLVVSDGSSESDVAVVTITVGVANVAPVAQAGLAQNVVAGSRVTLDGSASSDANRDPLTYKWTLVSKPATSTASLSSTTDVRPFFTADLGGTYVFSLQVSDGSLSSNFAAVTIVATTVNAQPVANAGAAQSVVAGSRVTLDGSGSSDANRDPLTYKWAIVTKPATSTASLSDATVAKPFFTADLPGIYVFSLMVNDGMTDSAVANVVVEAGAVNAKPVARITMAQIQPVATGTTVTLSGTTSTDADNDTLTYRWTLTKPLTSISTLVGANSASPTFVPNVAGTYVVTLIVNDSEVDSEPAVLVITVGP